MKKKTIIMAVAVMATLVMSGCCLKHEWKEATCTEPVTCAKCGETEGEALGHEWAPATCEEPETCTRCGETQGEALGHEWVEATFIAPKTCTVCGATEGEAHTIEEHNPTVMKADYPIYAVYDEGMVLCDEENDVYTWTSKTWDGEEVYTGTFDATGANAWGIELEDNKCVVITSYGILEGDHINWQVNIYDFAGNLIGDNLQLTTEGYDYIQYFWCEDNVYSVVSNDTREIMGYLDATDTPVFISKDEYLDRVEKEGLESVDYDRDKWCCYEEEPVINGYFVGTTDRETWGYLDKDGNELAMYKDATSFSDAGFALVRNDEDTYNVIDKDLNTIEGGELKGVSAAYDPEQDNFYVTTAEDEKIYVKIK